MSAFPIGALLGGGLLSGLGGIVGGSSSNRAGRKARDWYNARTGEGMDRILGLLFGNALPGARDYAGGRELDDTGVNLARSIGAPGGVYGQLNRANNQLGDRFANISGRLQRQQGESQRRADGLMGLAQQWGQGAERLIDQETARGLTGANRTATAAATARGMGNSSTLLNTLSENSMDFARQAAGQKIGVRGQALDRQMDAGRFATDNLNRNAALFASTREGQARTMNDLRRSNANTLLSMFQSPTMNPWLGNNTSQYYPGVSGAGSALAGTGNALGSLGSFLLMQQMFGQGNGQGGGGR